MARSKRAGDIATKARKRYYRAAERYLRQARETTGATAGRFRELARLKFNDAIKTYSGKSTQAFSKPIQRIASELGIDLQTKRESISELSEKARIKTIKKSKQSLAGTKMTAEELRESEAKAILNGPIGHRIIGGAVDIWRESATVQDDDEHYQIDKTRILPALFEHYGVENLADLLEKIESEIGESLYKNPDSEEMYETVKITLQMANIAGSNAFVS